jgi:Stage II sporulation protein E (SpoIIE)
MCISRTRLARCSSRLPCSLSRLSGSSSGQRISPRAREPATGARARGSASAAFWPRPFQRPKRRTARGQVSPNRHDACVLGCAMSDSLARCRRRFLRSRAPSRRPRRARRRRRPRQGRACGPIHGHHQDLIRINLRENRDLPGAMQNPNAYLVNNNAGGLFATLVYAAYDPRSGELEYCSCGHLPRVEAAVREFAPGRSQFDDITCLALRRRGAGVGEPQPSPSRDRRQGCPEGSEFAKRARILPKSDRHDEGEAIALEASITYLCEKIAANGR